MEEDASQRHSLDTYIDDPVPDNPILRFLYREANFFRIHLFFFTFAPLVASAVFWGANGDTKVPYIDCLFLTYSSMTVTGLSTINLSTITSFQQSILFVLMLLGDVTMVALVMVLVRKYYFRLKCERVMRNQKVSLARTFTRHFTRQGRTAYGIEKEKTKKENPVRRIVRKGSDFISGPFKARPLNEETGIGGNRNGVGKMARSASGAQVFLTSPTPAATTLGFKGERGGGESDPSSGGLDANGLDLGRLTESPLQMETDLPQEGLGQVMSRQTNEGGTKRRKPSAVLSKSMTLLSSKGVRPKARDRGLGGLPGPVTITRAVLSHVVPDTFKADLTRKLTIAPTTTLVGDREKDKPEDIFTKYASWLTKIAELKIGRNSKFHMEDLTDEQLEDLGGIEYRALRVLGYLVAAYFIGTQFITFIIIGPYMASRYEDVFTSQPKLVNRWWFSAFQVVAGYTGGGLSLVDLGMVPFQRTYLMIVALSFVILAGNHALPLFLRLTIWIWSKFVQNDSEIDGTLHFLLDHPRRCFIYLFPSHQTWYLFTVLVLFSLIEWVSFTVLNRGLTITESLPVGTRLIDGLFQGIAARASGFSIVSISSLAPAIQFLYLVMMYIAVYPVAMSIRSTNVYEEKSLGVFEAPADDEDEEPDMGSLPTRGERVGKYLHWHLRRQLSNDIWWLVWGIWLVCICERTNILDESKPWFDEFRVCFELVSAFGGIGLSLGTADDNFAFSGSCGTLSKLVIICIMLRGRHRGLPSAVDRSIMLPSEFRSPAQQFPEPVFNLDNPPKAPPRRYTVV